jgi:hypothetical protein
MLYNISLPLTMNSLWIRLGISVAFDNVIIMFLCHIVLIYDLLVLMNLYDNDIFLNLIS